MSDRRQPAYDATYAVIRQYPAGARENGRVWRAVEAALDAMGVPAGNGQPACTCLEDVPVPPGMTPMTGRNPACPEHGWAARSEPAAEAADAKAWHLHRVHLADEKYYVAGVEPDGLTTDEWARFHSQREAKAVAIQSPWWVRMAKSIGRTK